MKKLLIPITVCCVLTACTTGTNVASLNVPIGTHYQEIQLGKLSESEGTYQGVEQAAESHALLAKQGNALPVKNIRGDNLATGLPIPPLCKKYPDGHLCFLFKNGNDEYIAVPTETPKEGPMSKATWTVFKNGQELFSAPMNYGAEGPIVSVTLIDDKPAVTFLRDLRTGVLDENGPKPDEVTQDTFYNDAMINDSNNVETSHGIFSWKGTIGFVGKRDGKEMVFFNGKPVTKPFDAIRTSSCCAVPHFEMVLHDNGALLLVGERDGFAYLTEVNLNQ